jgi:hypothetical protein
MKARTSQGIRLSLVPPRIIVRTGSSGLFAPFLPPRVFVKCLRIRKMVGRGGGDRTHDSVSSHLSVDYLVRWRKIPSRGVIFGSELTGAVELLLFLGVVHLGIEINLGDFK